VEADLQKKVLKDMLGMFTVHVLHDKYIFFKTKERDGNLQTKVLKDMLGMYITHTQNNFVIFKTKEKDEKGNPLFMMIVKPDTWNKENTWDKEAEQ